MCVPLHVYPCTKVLRCRMNDVHNDEEGEEIPSFNEMDSLYKAGGFFRLHGKPASN